jgi:hypothetical protein
MFGCFRFLLPLTRPLDSKRVPQRSPEEEGLEGLWLTEIEDEQMTCVEDGQMTQLAVYQSSVAKDASSSDDRKSTCLKAHSKRLLASEGSERGYGLDEEEFDSASGSSAGLMSMGLMSLPQDLLASILKDVALGSKYSVGQHVEVKIHECFEYT